MSRLRARAQSAHLCSQYTCRALDLLGASACSFVPLLVLWANSVLAVPPVKDGHVCGCRLSFPCVHRPCASVAPTVRALAPRADTADCDGVAIAPRTAAGTLTPCVVRAGARVVVDDTAPACRLNGRVETTFFRPPPAVTPAVEAMGNAALAPALTTTSAVVWRLPGLGVPLLAAAPSSPAPPDALSPRGSATTQSGAVSLAALEPRTEFRTLQSEATGAGFKW